MTERAELLHVVYWLRAEGVPRLALDLLQLETAAKKPRNVVAILDESSNDLRPEFERLATLRPLPWGKRQFAGLLWRTVQLLRELRPKGVICYSLGVHVPVAVACAALRIPCIVHIGNAPPSERLPLAKLRIQMKAGDAFTRGYAACSDYVRDAVIDAYGLPKPKVLSIPNGIDLNRFATDRRNGRERAGRIVVGMVGSFEVHKDQATLVRACAVLARRGVSVELRLVGDGTERASLQRIAEAEGIAEHVVFTGRVRDVPAELAKLDVFVYSVTPQEGLGLALVEAMAAGVPVVGTDVGACREVLAGGALGELVPPARPAEMADAITRAAETRPVSLEALQRYDRTTMWRSYRALLGLEG